MKDLIIGNPYTTQTVLTDKDDFLIIACDGVWDVCTDSEAVELVKDVQDVQKAAERLLQYSLDNHSTDNLSAIVVRFDRSWTPARGEQPAGQVGAATASAPEGGAQSA